MGERLIQQKEVKNYIVKSVAWAVIASGLIYYLFFNGGPIAKYGNIDLSFLILAFIGYYFLRLLSRLCKLYLTPRIASVASIILNGLAFSFFSYWIFSHATLFTRIPILKQFDDSLFTISRVSAFPIIFWIGYAIIKIAKVIKTLPRYQLSVPIMSILGEILIGYSFWYAANILKEIWPPFQQIGWILLAAMLGMAVSDMGIYGERYRSSVWKDFLFWLKSSPINKSILAGLIAVYVVIIRPEIYSHVSYAFLVEWVIVCFIAWRIFNHYKNTIQRNYIGPVIETAWSRHIQRINRIADDDFEKVLIYQDDFISSGIRRNLLIFSKQLLISNGYKEEDIGQILRSVIEYNDYKIPWYAFGIWKKRIQNLNIRNRRQALDNMMKELEIIIHPPQRKN